MRNLLLVLSIVTLFGCVGKSKMFDEYISKKSIITNVKIEEPNSTIEFDKKYIYETDSGQRVISRNDNNYHVGDTIIILYKK